MANKSFSRGVETLGAQASMVFVGNTSHNVPYMLKHSDLFDELPESYHDSAYLDRLHCYIPGWEVDAIRSEMFSDGYGFVVDYIAEVLKSMGDADYSDRYAGHFTLDSDISTRDRDGISKTFSGLMKIIYPQGEATKEQIEEILQFAVEGRKRVTDQTLRIDTSRRVRRLPSLGGSGTWEDRASTPRSFADARCGWSQMSRRSTGRSGLRSARWPASSEFGAPETVRTWVRRAEVDACKRPGVTSDDAEELKRLKREVAQLSAERFSHATAAPPPSAASR